MASVDYLVISAQSDAMSVIVRYDDRVRNVGGRQTMWCTDAIVQNLTDTPYRLTVVNTAPGSTSDVHEIPAGTPSTVVSLPANKYRWINDTEYGWMLEFSVNLTPVLG